MHEHFIGIDVSKLTIDACLLKKGALGTPALETFPNTKDGFRRPVAWAKQSRTKPESTLLGMEHTGIYTEALEKFLHKKVLPFAKPDARGHFCIKFL